MPPMPNLLVIDDDLEWCKLVRMALEPAGYTLTIVHNGTDALQAFARQQPDLVLLDIQMPGMDGHDLCRRLRARSNVPILVLSVLGDQTHHVVGILHEGADDIISKSHSAAELLARIEVILRRASRVVLPVPPRIYDDGVLTLDLEGNSRVLKRGQEVELSPTELKLLRALYDQEGAFVSRAELLHTVWGKEYGPEIEYLAVYIRYLRIKLEDDPSKPRYIITKHRFGYGLVPELSDQLAEALEADADEDDDADADADTGMGEDA